jgi:hypothetical protein
MFQVGATGIEEEEEYLSSSQRTFFNQGSLRGVVVSIPAS